MTDKDLIKEVEALLAGQDRIDIDLNDSRIVGIAVELKKARVRLALAQNGLAMDFPSPGTSDPVAIYRVSAEGKPAPRPAAPKTSDQKKATPKRRPKPKRHQHTYVPPRCTADIVALLTDPASHVVGLVGPTGCGKSTLVRYLGSQTGRKVYQINCVGDMSSAEFFGEKTVEVDEDTGQNKVVYQKGTVEQAMVAGLDENGNEVGEPAILFIDEFPACPAHIAHGLNRLFESDDPRRSITLNLDGGREVRSHSGFRIIVAGNTAGRGAVNMEQAVYTAQLDALDLSLLNRIRACFRMGYDRKVEEHILAEKLGDDRIARLVIQFRDAIREHIKAGKLTTPFGTRHIVAIADMYRIYQDLHKAIYYAIVEFLLPEERAVYNETAMAILGSDMMAKFVEQDIDYM